VIRAHAPGRVNLIGEHTDHTGGRALPVAVDLGTTVEVSPGGDSVVLRSDVEPVPAVVPLDVADPASVEPPWARYVAGVVAELRPGTGASGTVRTTLPVGAGLSSSAALEVAVALALGFDGTPVELALACQRAEQRASGVPCGVLDQMASACGIPGAALLLDCTTLGIVPVPLPDGVSIVVVDSGQRRTLAGSAPTWTGSTPPSSAGGRATSSPRTPGSSG
jgi:galactokinase